MTTGRQEPLGRLAGLLRARDENRWLALFLLTRVVGTSVAVTLLIVHRVTDHDALLSAITAAYGLTSAAAVVRWRTLQRHPLAFGLDAAATLALILASAEWRSPVYLLALSALVLPATALPFRRAVGFGLGFTLTYLGIAFSTGVNFDRLGSTALLETFATHLMVPMLVTFALAYGADILDRLRDERQRSERLAIEAERKRIAWELHDSAKQRVHAAHLVVSSLHRDAPPDLSERIELALGEMGAATGDMETSLAELRTPLEGRLLHEAVRERATQLAPAARAEIEVDGAAPVLPPLIAAHAYRIACEALANAVRHADARHIDVSMAGDAVRLAIAVVDDGRGMPVTVRPGSNGLRSMHNRARTIGGRLRIGAGPGGRGTAVHLDVPLEGAPT